MSIAADRPRSTTRPREREVDRTQVRIQRHTGQKLRTGIQAVVIAVWCLLPFYWMVVTSFRDVGFTFDPTPWFTHFTFANYETAFSTALGNHLGRALLNSVFIGITVTVIALLVGTSAAYALARLEFKGKSLIAGAILAASMFPASRSSRRCSSSSRTSAGWARTRP